MIIKSRYRQLCKEKKELEELLTDLAKKIAARERPHGKVSSIKIPDDMFGAALVQFCVGQSHGFSTSMSPLMISWQQLEDEMNRSNKQ